MSTWWQAPTVYFDGDGPHVPLQQALNGDLSHFIRVLFVEYFVEYSSHSGSVLPFALLQQLLQLLSIGILQAKEKHQTPTASFRFALLL